MKIILDLCGGSGAWSRPYKEAGYDVRLITLPSYNVLDYLPPRGVYGILAAPPCTMFSVARTTARKERDFREGMEVVSACMRIIWECRYSPLYKKDGALKFWALENPKGFLRQFLGIPPFNFDPCDFGDNYTKSTDLWGVFNFPKKDRIELSDEEKQLCAVNSRELPGGNMPVSGRRAVTPEGFARAFFKSNR